MNISGNFARRASCDAFRSSLKSRGNLGKKLCIHQVSILVPQKGRRLERRASTVPHWMPRPLTRAIFRAYGSARPPHPRVRSVMLVPRLPVPWHPAPLAVVQVVPPVRPPPSLPVQLVVPRRVPHPASGLHLNQLHGRHDLWWRGGLGPRDGRNHRGGRDGGCGRRRLKDDGSWDHLKPNGVGCACACSAPNRVSHGTQRQ